MYTFILMAASRSILPSTFTYAQARAAGVSKHELYKLRDEGRLEPLSRGLYRRADDDIADLELVEIARRAPSATLCLATALARHDLSDEIPQALDIALPRGTRTPVTAAPVQWHHFDRATFEIGREALRLDEGTSIGLYTAERCIIDAFRTRATGGHELAYEALKRWSRRRRANAGALLKLAAAFPRTVTPIRKALEILL
jgi:predicted transcriptional regulator of viral defense system